MAVEHVDDELWNEFHRVVNMTSGELREWLLTRAADEDGAVEAGTALELPRQVGERDEEPFELQVRDVHGGLLRRFSRPTFTPLRVRPLSRGGGHRPAAATLGMSFSFQCDGRTLPPGLPKERLAGGAVPPIERRRRRA